MKIRQTVGAAVFSTGLVLSLASFAGATSGAIGDTGPWSNNQISSSIRQNLRVNNNNNLHVTSDNDQHAYTGDAKVFFNTSGGGAVSGSAANANAQNVSASVSNLGPTSGGWGGGFGLNG